MDDLYTVIVILIVCATIAYGAKKTAETFQTRAAFALGYNQKPNGAGYVWTRGE